jgi:hypothetical protein
MIPEVGEKGKLGQKATCVNRTVAFLLCVKQAGIWRTVSHTKMVTGYPQ